MTTETASATVPGPREEQAPNAEHGHGGRIITALEAAWAAIRANHPDVPDVVMITGTARQLGGDRWGHYGPDFWAVPAHKKARASELFIAGELIALGGRSVMKTLLHEAAHGVAHRREIRDTSGSGNRYHNKRFVKLAEELGLQSPAEPIKTHGWTCVTLPDATAEKYGAVIAELDAAGLPYLGAPAVNLGGDEDQDDEPEGGTEEGSGEDETPKKKRREGKRIGVQCQCETPRKLQVTPKVLDDGPVICGICKEEFAPPHQDEDDE